MDLPELLRTICRRWFPVAPFRLAPLSGGGFSGSPVWIVEPLDAAGSAAGRYVLKGFAQGWPLERGVAIHRLVSALREAGIDAVPPSLPLSPPGQGTIAADGEGRLWEMTQWRPGEPVPAPSARQARAAVETLARIHVAAHGTDGGAGKNVGLPPAWGRRVEALRAVIATGWGQPPAVAPGRQSPLQLAVAERKRAAASKLQGRGGLPWLKRLAELSPPPVALQPVLRDIWQAHMLFVGDQVSAVIDFHACGIDTPATDLARLLGSWEPPTADRGERGPLTEVWREALIEYEAIRPLSADERFLIDLLHVTGVVGGLQHWFRWVLDEHRPFPDPSRVVPRIDFLMKNLDSILEQTDAGHRRLH